MSNPAGYNKISLKGDQHNVYDEGLLVTAPATPGMNLVMTTAANVFERQSYAPGAAPAGVAGQIASPGRAAIVIENSIGPAVIGTGVMGTIDTAYAVGDTVRFIRPLPGDEFLAFVKSGQTVTKGGLMAPDATGKFIVAAAGATVEALDASTGALGADTHIRVRAL